jgi:acetyl-CoA synthetase
MSKFGIHDLKSFHRFSIEHFQDFWQAVMTQLEIVFDKPPEKICDEKNSLEAITWFPHAKINIANSCFTAPKNSTAIIYEDENKILRTMTYDELNRLSNRIANSLVQQGYKPGDAIAIAMPMHAYAVAIYLGIIKMGAIVVSIADSFSSEEIGTRLKIANAKAIFTQDFIAWGNKKLPLYEKVKNNPHSVKIITLPAANKIDLPLRAEDISFADFLVTNDAFTALSCDPMTACNILFSSGTTGIPKAIPWNHTTPIKAASDAYFHQNIKENDVLAWPTNLGWMMGPWLIFAALINHAAIALYQGAPKDREFGEFIQHAKVTMLGVVPTLVAAWRESHCMEKLDWRAIKVFTSTGECSNPDDMLYLMSLGGHKPVIEYCGGTEIGGAYLSSTVIEKNYPSLFTTPTMGLDITIIDEAGKPASQGEVAIIPPSIGLSTTLLNGDHHEVYFANMPHLLDGKILRRHGDQLKQFPHGLYTMLGRVDDTMNLGGIKISAAEIERVLTGLPEIIETAAIAIPPPDNGPSLLIIYAAVTADHLDKTIVMRAMQAKINQHLNPLFKIHDVIFTKELPKTASNKIMRRILRKQYVEKSGRPELN